MSRDQLGAALYLFTSVLPAWAQDLPPRQLTSGPGESRAPTWAPDGQWLAYESNATGRWALYAVAVDSGTVRVLVRDGHDNRYPAWSPDGSSIAFVSNRDGIADLYTLSLKDGAVSRVTTSPHTEELFPSWAPDGASIWYSAREPDGVPEIYAVDVPGGSVRRLTSESERRHGVWPRWRADGLELAFFSRHDTGGSDDEIYLRDSRSGKIRRITTRPGHDFCPTWSPDGRLLAIVSLDPDSEGRRLQVIDRRGTPLYTLAPGIRRVTEPAWAPDGRRIAFTGLGDSGLIIYLQEIAVGHGG